MNISYHRLSFLEREEISRGLARGETFTSIAIALRRSKSAISREVNATGVNKRVYRAATAEKRALRQAKNRHCERKIEMNSKLRNYAINKLRSRWSPEQIEKQLKIDYPYNKEMRASHETIYTYIYVLPKGELKKELLSCLRTKRKHRRKRTRLNNKGAEKKIEDMISIEERPKEVASRTAPGHWEGDLIVGRYNKSAIGTLVERTTRTTILVPLKRRDAKTVRQTFAREAKNIPKQMRLTLTYDQGREMAEHKLFTKETKMQVYFAHPRSPWERGTNENTNGLIRQFFPKGTDFNKVSRKEIKHVQHLLNGRPRKCLDFRKPYEVFKELVALET